MAFTPRSFTQILTDMIAYVQARTDFTDFTVGSLVRTMLEAAALEDDEQYFQMVQILDLFSYTTAAGQGLDRRLADFNIFRRNAQAAFGKVKFFNANLKYSQAAVDATAGATTLQIFDSSEFPIPSPSYTIRIGEGTIRAQTATVTALGTASNVFTVSALSKDVQIGDRVALIDGSPVHLINIGTNIQAPATVSEDQRIFRATEQAAISQGNFYSNEVTVISTSTGTSGNVGASRITQFVGSAPFNGAGVINNSSISGGLNTETDADFRERAIDKLQSLSRGTVLSLRAEVIGIEDPNTGQRVASSNVLEDFSATFPSHDEVIVYIDDGTGFSPDSVSLAVATGTGALGTSTLALDDSTSFPSSGHVLVELNNTNLILRDYESNISNNLTLTQSLPNNVTSKDVRQVQVASSGADEGQRRGFLNNPPVVRNTERIYIKAPLDTTFTLLEPNIDYVLNKGNGEFLLTDLAGLTQNTIVIASYSYYTNLLAEVQKVIEGDINDSNSYPGVKAAGIFCTVEAPFIKRITVRVSITAESTFVAEDLAPLVATEISSYVNSLKIGRDVIRSRIIDAAHNVQGVRSAVLVLPTSDVVVLENELPRAFDSSGNSTITVS